ncbi:MAG: ATP-binding cassette domain-containing protein [Aeromicrobium sp.]
MARGEVRVEGLTWRPLGRRQPTIAKLDLFVSPGERVLLLGPSGAGKSTILLALAGALGTTLAGDLSGRAEVEGRIGLVPQNPADAIVAEHLGRDAAFGLENAGMVRDEIWPKVDAALASVGLTYGRGHLVTALSGGELQRLVLAGVLALEPDVMLLDEPTSMLDAASSAAAREAVTAAADDRTLIVVEHRCEPWLDHVDRVVVLDRGGRIVSDGTPAGFVAGPPIDGVWMPGAPPPVPLAVPDELVRPSSAGPVQAVQVAVTLISRTLRGVQRVDALRDFSAALEPGRITALTGESGSGKSTALAAVGGLQRLASGRVHPDRARMSSRRLAADVGWMPQNAEHGFLTHTVADEIRRTGQVIDRFVDTGAVLDAFGLAALAGANPFRLSGGEQRRVALAAALAHRPGLLLLDEPTVGQDPATWAAVTGWMTSARNAGATVAFATHDDDAPRDAEIRLMNGVVQ